MASFRSPPRSFQGRWYFRLVAFTTPYPRQIPRLSGYVSFPHPIGIFVEIVEQRWGDRVASLEIVRVEFRERSQDHTEDVQVTKRLQSEGLLAYVFVKSV
jgi:hypothetical protein